MFEAQRRSVLDGDVVVMDETPFRAGRDPERPGRMRKGWFWPVLGDRDEVVFHYARSRAHRHVPEFLGGFQGTLVSDGYGAYEAYAAARGKAVEHQSCWIHCRRNFEELKNSHPAMAGEVLDMIGQIYRIEKEIRSKPPPERLAARRTLTRPVVEGFWQWCGETLDNPELTPRHPIRRAINYAVERKEALEVFLSDPDVPPDTNAVERTLRRVRLGENNWLFSWTEFGARNVGIVNSLLATCQLHGVDCNTWLVDVLQRIGGHPANRVEELTPRRWKELFADNPMTSDADRGGTRRRPYTPARGPQ